MLNTGLIWIGVFSAMFAVDYIWPKWTYAITAKNPIVSSNYSAILILLSGLSTIGYANDPWLLIPTIAGAWAGTWCSVTHTNWVSNRAS